MTKDIQDQINTFFAQFPQHHQPAGATLVQPNEHPEGIYYLTAGTVKQSAITIDGEEVVINLFKPPAFFPMSWAINDTANAFYLEAETDITYHLAPKQQTVQFIQDHPDVMFNLLGRVYRGTDGLLQRMSYLMSGNKYANVMTEILITAKRFGQPGTTLGSLVVELPQQDLAARSGMARETVNREMRRLKDQGLISVEHSRITIPDVAKLESELAGQ